MEKIKVSKEVVKALHEYRFFTFADMMQLSMEKGFDFGGVLNNMKTKELAIVLIHGYEIEESPKEKWGRLASKCKYISESEEYNVRMRNDERKKLEIIKEINKDFGLGIGGL